MFDVRREGETWPNTLWLTEKDEERLRNLAKDLGVTESKVVQAALEFYESCLDSIARIVVEGVKE